jgi:hypothetical protein
MTQKSASGTEHEKPHFHPKTGACDCLCPACDLQGTVHWEDDRCICPECNGECGQPHARPDSPAVTP